ncbi:kinetochore protein Spc7/SPC105 [Entomortierella parvispora]|uniref:Kinetochore protein Spc7/SPC105 n=1 Tax=Entomortierella parvispora TaxID=205924 RepID=A0A9P3LUD6_9FUNG|nr:kinetochore protein Spc7/SPC105 [Entomortierella parvispora]
MDEDPVPMQEHAPVHADGPVLDNVPSEQTGESTTVTEPAIQEDNQHNQSNPDNQSGQLLLKRPLDQEDATSPSEEPAHDQSPPPSAGHNHENNDINNDTNNDNNNSSNEHAESNDSSNKRRRISFPGKSILKSSTQDGDGDLSMEPGVTDELNQQAESAVSALDVTETFSGTTEFTKRNRRSIGRRVSFATTARIRMFERDEKEDEHAKTTSFVEGLNPRISPDHAFSFENSQKDAGNSSDTGHDSGAAGTNDDTMDSASSINNEGDDQEPRSETTTGSSDSEKERSFEVNIGHSDNTGSSGGAYSVGDLLSSSLGDFGSNPFDESDAGQASSSDDDTKEIFPPQKFMKRSSGVSIGFLNRDDNELGPAADVDGGTQDFDGDSRDFSTTSQDNYQEDSMDYRFQNHRSSLTGQPVTAEEREDTFEFLSMDQIAGPSGHLDAPMSQMSDGDTLDMDITAPIGGILEQEQPPTSFHATEVEEDTVMSQHDLTDMSIGQEREPLPPVSSSDATTPAPAPAPAPANATTIAPPAPTAPVTQNPPSSRSSIPSANPRSNPLLVRIFNRSASSDDLKKHKDTAAKEAAKERLSLDGSSNSENRPKFPSTPPRRTSFLRNFSSPAVDAGRELGTPQKYTPNVRASFNIFPEVMEKQLQHLETSKPAVPVFQAPHVSPETSNLARRIARYSSGSFGMADPFLDGGREDQPEPLNRVEYPRPGMDSSVMEGIETEDIPTEDLQASLMMDDQDNDEQDQSSEMQSEGMTDEDSFSELPPITLNKFLSLAGIHFMDHLVASTRRRTITHRPTMPESPSKTSYRFVDFARATAAPAAQLHAHREGCKLLKEFEDASRKQVPELEKRINTRNPECFRDLREGDAAAKDFIKKQFQLIKKYCTLDSAETLNELMQNLLEDQRDSLEYHLSKLAVDRETIKNTWTKIAADKPKVTSRYHDLKRQLELARGRRNAFVECDKAQLEYLAESIDELGTQLKHFKVELVNKRKEESEIQSRVNQLKMAEQAIKARVAVAEKTIEDYQYVGPEDLYRAKEMLGIVQDIHLWRPLGPVPTLESFQQNQKLQFVYDHTLKVSIDMTKMGKAPDAVQVSIIEEDPEVAFNLTLTEKQPVAISALKPKKRKSFAEYAGLLKDYMTLITSAYKAGTAISKILSDISTFWTKISLIRRDIELVRTHNVVDIVAGSEENIKELERNKVQVGRPSPPRQVPGSPVTTPIVLLDIRVRFTGPILGARRSERNRTTSGGSQENGADGHRRGHGHGRPAHEEPVKFYLWFTFTLNDLLNFPGPSSFTWRLEVVYGSMSHEQIADVIGPSIKKGGYESLRDVCVKVNQILRT